MVRLNLPRYRYWKITWFKFDIDFGDKAIIDRFGINFVYLVYQVEKCPDTDRLHFEMYLELKNPVNMKTIQKWFPTCHAEKRMGTREQCRDYCMKEDSRFAGPYEFGEFKPDKQGKRTDLENVKEDIALGLSEEELWESNFATMVKFHKGINMYRSLKAKKKSWTTLWSLYIGDPGTGKTTYANKHYPEAYWKSHTQWWDGYIGQSVVVWDEFKGQYPYGDLMRLHDPVNVNLQIKGGSTQFMANELIMISNYSPDQWYDYAKTGLNAESLMRRFDFVYLFVKGIKTPFTFPDFMSFAKHYMEFGLTKGDLEEEKDEDEVDLRTDEAFQENWF